MKKNNQFEKQIINLKKNFFPFEQYERVSKGTLSSFNKNRKLYNLSSREEQYYEFLYDFLFKIDTNIVEVARGLKTLLNKKNLMPSIFLLRGTLELIFFNIFVTFKSFKNIKNNNLDAFIDIILRGSLATDVEGFKSNSLKSESVIYNKIIKKYKGKRLHINDCIRFLKKNTVCKIIGTKETNSSKCYKTLEKTIRPNKMNEALYFLITNEDLGKETNEIIINTYDKMCEIIHPTAIKIYDATDKKIQNDYQDMFLRILDTPLFLTNLYSRYYKEFICEWFLENKEEFINAFNKKII